MLLLERDPTVENPCLIVRLVETNNNREFLMLPGAPDGEKLVIAEINGWWMESEKANY